jgi:triosephosphate isomerase (TIM)
MSLDNPQKTSRKPMAEANWKMAMTVAESLSFLQEFCSLAANYLEKVDVLLCPPYTAIWPVAQALNDMPIQLGVQNLSAVDDLAHTGQISAALAFEAGCRWAVVGHWEVRRDMGDDDERLNRKVHLALAAGLRPLLMIGERRSEASAQPVEIASQLGHILENCNSGQVSGMAIIYEPVWAIGAAEPASPEHAARGCASIRSWLSAQYGPDVAQAVRVLYGGSVSPAHAPALLSSPDIDGLGTGRQGRQAAGFADIVKLIASAKVG